MAWADRTPLERLALRYCAPRGIPLSVFLHQRVGEPQWTEDDMLAALDWQVEEDNRCSVCGQSLDESMKKENSYVYRAEALRCHGCHAIHMEEARLAGRQANTNAGTRYRVELVKPDVVVAS